MNPVLALGLVAAAGLQVPRVPAPRWYGLDLALAAGAPFVALGLVLGPGIEFITRPLLQVLAPVTALAIGWLGAGLGARFEWRSDSLAAHAPFGWVYWIGFAIASGTLVGLLFLSLTRVAPRTEELGLALLGSVLFGAGVGYAADLSPFVVSAVAGVVIVNWSARRRQARSLLAAWERPIVALFLVVTGALLTLPTPWILAAVALIAALRVGARWAIGRLGGLVLKPAAAPRYVGLATVAQGAAAVALGVNYVIAYGGRPESRAAAGGVLATVVLGVAVAQLVAPPLMRLAQPGSDAAGAER